MRTKLILLLFLFTFRAGFATGPIRDLIKQAGDATSYPNDNLLVVFDSTKVNVSASGLSYEQTHVLYKVLTSKGALELNVIKFGYDPLSAYTEIRKVTIFKKDGTVRELDIKNVLDYPAPARAIYWGAREKMIQVGRLDPGDALEVEQFKKGFTYALLAGEGDDDDKYIPPMKGQFYDIVDFWSSNPEKEKVYQVSVPQDKHLQYQVYNGELQSSAWINEDKVMYTFSKKDLTPFKSEPKMVSLSDVAPKLLISTCADWKLKSTWFYKVNEDYGSFDYTPEIKTKVDEILKGSTSEMDSIGRLTHWVGDEIRYSGISMGCGEGYTLHKGAMTFTDRCGVCKDKAGMLITMLRAAGFKSYPAMTMAGSRIDYIAADQFNHCITVIKLHNGKYRLLDPTWVPFVRELWSSAEQQQQYLMGVPEGADLATTDLSSPENHYLRITGNSELSNEGTLKGSVTITAEGQTDASIRSVFRYSSPVQWNQIIEKELLKISSLAKITALEIDDPLNYQTGPIRIKMDYIIPDYAMVSGDKLIFGALVASNFLRVFQPHLSFETGLKERKYPFRDRCSRLVELTETIKLPDVKNMISQPESKNDTGSVCSFTGGYKLSGNILTLKETVILGKRIYEAGDWPEFRKVITDQNSFAEHPVILQIQNSHSSN
ncbi:MAG: DUF3857 and transglutaminase domain-containing protein [Bacteroidetes bacterium]|nr:DUF3857 and transglutaminase domain-containing protein [Bacteroidota bacterium]